jgi:hypothetical protein
MMIHNGQKFISHSSRGWDVQVLDASIRRRAGGQGEEEREREEKKHVGVWLN